MAGKKSRIQKKLEMLRKTQEVNAIVERGSVEEQALLDSAGEVRPVDEEQVSDLLDSSEEESPYMKQPKAKGAKKGARIAPKKKRK